VWRVYRFESPRRRLVEIALPHAFGIVGLIINMFAVLLLLKYPPRVTEYTRDGRPIIGWGGVASEAGKRKYTMRKYGYQFAISLLFLGFFLQLLDLIKT
jgi:hypothetical protein